MDIKHPRRILALGVPGSPILEVIKDLTGSAPPTDENGSAAGSSHEWAIETAYYKAKVPLWVDEIADSDAWRDEFMKPEAKEVVEAIGGYIYCFRMPQNGEISKEIEDVMRVIQAVCEEHAGYGADTVMLAVGLPHCTSSNNDAPKINHDDWDDSCMQFGFEFINYTAKGTNEFGERVGFERMKEALEASEWAAAGDEDDELDIGDLDFDAADDLGGFNREEAEMTAELFGMKAALSGAEDHVPEAESSVPPDRQSEQVDNLDRLMGKLLAVKEQSAELPEAQRKRMAAKAVTELMGKGREV